ncbi:MAG: hypothetical protein ABI459_07575, partial [Deltaproteobacteria bacterium]
RFNTDIFHCDPRRDRQKAALDDQIGAERSHQIMIGAIGMRVEVLRSLALALAPLRNEVDEFHLP